MPEVICLGEILIDMIPDKEDVSWSEISNFSPVPGGAPANVCIALSKLGVNTGFIGKVGKDPFGELLVEILRENGVDVSQVKFDSDVRTTLAFVSTHKDRENDFIFYRNPGADMMLRSEDLDEDFIAGSKIFHFGSISMTNEPSRSATFQAIRVARKNRVFLSFDPNLRPRLWKNLKEARNRIIEGIKSADLVKVNDIELEFITGKGDLVKGTSWLLQRGPQVVVVTRGEKGAFFRNKETFSSIPSYNVKVADTVGCGDAFTAAIIYQFLLLDKEGQDISGLSKGRIKDILSYANAAAALTATRKGVIPSLPTRKEIERFLKIAQKS